MSAARVAGDRQQVSVDGHRVALTHLDRVLYPETGTTKADALDYVSRVADALLPGVIDRPVTRKRWPVGVGTAVHPGEVFFHKQVDQDAPDWIPRRGIEHRDRTTEYPLVRDRAALVWFTQRAALELHVPQWRFGPRGAVLGPDRLVLDLDPGEGAGLAECAEVARRAKRILDGMGLAAFPVTSGSKGIHLYAALDGRQSSDDVTEVAHELARALEADSPDLVISSMRKADRRGRVLVDWSQNRAAKTTVAPYSLRGTAVPRVAAPRTWAELDDPDLAQLGPAEVLDRLERDGDLLEGLRASAAPAGAYGGPVADRLDTYRSMRNAERTPEPVPTAAPMPGDDRSFVIQKHHATRLHYDFRLEREGVLVSWAIPKGVPRPGEKNRLAVPTEDHPLEYGSFEGEIPKSEYGGGSVSIWDAGRYDAEKWREDEVIVVLHGRPEGGLGGEPVRLALIRTGGRDDAKPSWLVHRMALESDGAEHDGTPHGRAPHRPAAGGTSARDAAPPSPMLASTEDRAGILLAASDGDWWVEMKWDGVRAVAVVDPRADPPVVLLSRNDVRMQAAYPELDVLAERTGGRAVVLDGEIVAPDRRGRPDFARLQTRMRLERPADIAAARERTPVQMLLFDVLRVDGDDLTDRPLAERRAVLEETIDEDATVRVPPAFRPRGGEDFASLLDRAVGAARDLGLEGVVVKRQDAAYAAGRRSRAWLKAKEATHQEVVVIGWREGRGRRAGGIGSLLVAIPDGDGALRYVGRVGTGFRDADLDDAAGRLRSRGRTTPPADDIPAADRRDAHWVRPDLVAEVAIAGFTGTGALRQASWRGWRPDRDAHAIRRAT